MRAPKTAAFDPADWSLISRLLTPRQARTCASAWLDRLSHRQIAARQGIARATVAWRIKAAKRRLRAANLSVPRLRVRTRVTACSLTAFAGV
jgi:hypothetical protein